jgi:hypothetical protein
MKDPENERDSTRQPRVEAEILMQMNQPAPADMQRFGQKLGEIIARAGATRYNPDP